MYVFLSSTEENGDGELDEDDEGVWSTDLEGIASNTGWLCAYIPS